MIERHESPRTLIQVVDGQPVQVTHERWPISIERIDLSPVPVEQRGRGSRSASNQPSSDGRSIWTTASGIRATVLRLDEDDHVFVIAIHHIVCDGWSLGVLYRELGVIYRALSRHEPPDLPDSSVQYGDYAAWQHQRIARAEFAKEENFWKEYLSGAPDSIDKPTKQTRKASFTYQGQKKVVPLGRDTTECLRGFCRTEGVSLFMALTATFETLLVSLHRPKR